MTIEELLNKVPSPVSCTKCPAGKYRSAQHRLATRCFACHGGMSSTVGAIDCTFSARAPVFDGNTSFAEERRSVDHWEYELEKHAASKLPHVLPSGEKRDCVLSQWSKFFGCDALHSASNRFRERHIKIPALNGGKQCSEFRYQLRACPHAKISEKQSVMNMLMAQLAGIHRSIQGVTPLPTPTQHTPAPVPARKVRGMQVVSAFYEQGIAPFITHVLLASADACMHLCMGKAECVFGTYYSGGKRKGECWLAAQGCTSCKKVCGAPCMAFRKLYEDNALPQVIKTQIRFGGHISLNTASFGPQNGN